MHIVAVSRYRLYPVIDGPSGTIALSDTGLGVLLIAAWAAITLNFLIPRLMPAIPSSS